MGSQNNGIEPPIFIESFQQQRRHWYTATAGDAVHRFPVRPSEVWLRYSSISDPPDPALVNDGNTNAVVTLRKSKALTLIPGTTHKYQHVATPITQVITATTGQVSPAAASVANVLSTPAAAAAGYTPVIQDSTGAIHPMQASTWVVDGINGYVEFPYGVPATMVAPFTLTFFEYVGATADGGSGSNIWHYINDATTNDPVLTPDPAYVSSGQSHFLVPLTAQSTEGAGTRLMFDVTLGAVRAGIVTGGQWDAVNRGSSSVAFGRDTTASGDFSVVGGGLRQQATNDFTGALSGVNNLASGIGAVVCGGGNTGGTAVAGEGNTASGLLSFVGGGGTIVGLGTQGNTASGDYSVVSGGTINTASGIGSVVVGGATNTAAGDHSTVSGDTNTVSVGGTSGAAVGGHSNTVAVADSGVFCGQVGQILAGVRSCIIGGDANTINTAGSDSGIYNGNTCTITSSGTRNSILGGFSNDITSGNDHVICGGNSNLISGGIDSGVLAGTGNTVSGTNSAIVGGLNCGVAADYCLVAGHTSSTGVGADRCVALGTSAIANHAGSFVWSDNSGGSLTTTTTNTFIARAANGFFFYTDTGLLSGAKLDPGASSWTVVSDRNLKENFVELQGEKILGLVDQLPIFQYNYKSQDPDKLCRGPVAQDWHELFPSGKDPLGIDTMDLDGVSLAAIKGLSSLAKTQATQIKTQAAQIKALTARLTAVENSIAV